MSDTLELTLDDVLAAGRVLFGPAFVADGQGWREALKTTYRRRALETHPDRAHTVGRSETELAREFRRVAEAYRVLAGLAAGPLPLSRPSVEPAPRRAAPRPAAARSTPRSAARPAASASSGASPRPGPRPAAPSAPGAKAPGQGPKAAGAAPRPAGARPSAHAAPGHGGHTGHASANPDSWHAASPGAHAAHAPGAPRVRASVRPEDLPRRKLRFAEFLYYSGKVTWTSFVEAVCWQRRQRPAIGRIAVDWGFLEPADVTDILERRRLADAHRVPFGEFAVRLGYLTSFQLLALLGRQLRLQKRIGEFFIERGLLEPGEIDGLRVRIARHNARWRE